jgi:hypothetical protein
MDWVPVLSAAVASAAIAFGAPVGVGALAAEPSQHLGPVAIADSVQGGWVRFTGPQGQELARISETGTVTPIALPPLLRAEARSEGVSLTPLHSGWLVVVGRFYPGGPSERSDCEESRDPSETCGELAVTELSPERQWSTPQPLPGSRGFDASETGPIELSGGRIQLAWEEQASDLPRIRVAVGRLGGRLGRPRAAQRLMRSEPEYKALEEYGGEIFVLGEFGRGRSGFSEHLIERRLYGDGHLGPPHFRHGPLIPEQGLRFPRPDGGETFVFGENGWAGFALRTPSSSTYVREHLFSKHAQAGVKAAEDRRGQVLIVLRLWRNVGSSLMAAEISPHGALEATHVLETGPPEPEGGYEYNGELGPGGRELVLSTDGKGGVWAHAAAPRCRRFTRTRLATGGAFPLLFAGARGVFHLVWTDDANGTAQTAAARVGCTARARR